MLIQVTNNAGAIDLDRLDFSLLRLSILNQRSLDVHRFACNGKYLAAHDAGAEAKAQETFQLYRNQDGIHLALMPRKWLSTD